MDFGQPDSNDVLVVILALFGFLLVVWIVSGGI
jgi:hypothetical protein